MSVISLDNRNPEDIAAEHPLLGWLARMYRWDSRFNLERGVRSTRDFVLSPECSGRFGIATDGESAFSLGILEADRDAFLSLTWSSAALVCGLKGKDYLILSCRDVAENWPGATGGLGPVPLRVFITLAGAVAEAMASADPHPTRLNLRAMRVKKGKAVLAKGEPPASVAFSIKVTV